MSIQRNSYGKWSHFLLSRDVPLAKNPSMGTAKQRLFLVLKVVLHAVVVISEVLRLSTKSRCSRCCRHISTPVLVEDHLEYEVEGPHPASRMWHAPVVLSTLEGVSIYCNYLRV